MPRSVAALLALALAGCTVGPDYSRPLVPDPGTYREPAPTLASIANTPWWELFEDPVLRDLVEASLRNNRDLRAAVARIDEAAAVLEIVRADLYPRVFYGGDAVGSGTSAGEGDVSGDGSLFLSAGWQLDLWGRFRRANEAALQELLGTEESYRGVTLSLVASVASSYLLLRDLDARLEISEQTVETRRGNVQIIQARFEGGSVSEIDLNQAQIQLSEAEVSVQVFERLRRQTENGLSLLLGEPPGTIERGRPLNEQAMPPDVPAGLPSELLDRRPDILVAERQLHAQTARIGRRRQVRYRQRCGGDIRSALRIGRSQVNVDRRPIGGQAQGRQVRPGDRELAPQCHNVVNPVAGLIFGAVHSVMHILLKPGFKEMLGADEDTVSSVVVFAATYFTSVIIAISMSAAVGFSASLFGGLILSLLMIPTSIAIEHIFRCAFNQELPQASDGVSATKV